MLRRPRTIIELFKDDGSIPNNPRLPLVVYKGALRLEGPDSAGAIEALLHSNHWGGSWRNGIYDFHHYHSTAHEVLLVYAGEATVRLGGDKGITQKLGSGDVVLIPAGVGHKNLGSSDDFAIIGAYPEGQSWDLCYGKKSERPDADKNITNVGLPKSDPVYGRNGQLMNLWRK